MDKKKITFLKWIKTATIESSGRDSKWKEGFCWIRRGNERFKMEGGLLLDYCWILGF
jgi:hypothetical protein